MIRNNLVQLLNRNELTIREMAEYTGLSIVKIESFIAGRLLPSKGYMRTICLFLKCRVQDIWPDIID